MSVASHTAEPYRPSTYKRNYITSQTCSRLNVDPNRRYIPQTSWTVPKVSPLIRPSSNPHPTKLLPAQRLRAERSQILRKRPGVLVRSHVLLLFKNSRINCRRRILRNHRHRGGGRHAVLAETATVVCEVVPQVFLGPPEQCFFLKRDFGEEFFLKLVILKPKL